MLYILFLSQMSARLIPSPSAMQDQRHLRRVHALQLLRQPLALLYPASTLTNPISYGEGLNLSGSHDAFSIVRPTIELPLDELLNTVDDSPRQYPTSQLHDHDHDSSYQQDVVMEPLPKFTTSNSSSPSNDDEGSNDSGPAQERYATVPQRPGQHSHWSTIAHRPHASLPGYSLICFTTILTSLNPAMLSRTNFGNTPTANVGNSAPGDVKARCSNHGATHMPLWRRGLNDRLNCNACGLYRKLVCLFSWRSERYF
jgi:GATA-binding protein